MSSLNVRPDGMKGGGALHEQQGNREELQHERTELLQEARRRGLLRPLRLEVTASRVEVSFSFSRRFNPNKTGWLSWASDGAAIGGYAVSVDCAVMRRGACAEVFCQESRRDRVKTSHKWRSSWAVSLLSLSSDATVSKHVVHIESNDASRFSLWANRVVIVERSSQSRFQHGARFLGTA
jgi:hypothetical protein